MKPCQGDGFQVIFLRRMSRGGFLGMASTHPPRWLHAAHPPTWTLLGLAVAPCALWLCTSLCCCGVWLLLWLLARNRFDRWFAVACRSLEVYAQCACISMSCLQRCVAAQTTSRMFLSCHSSPNRIETDCHPHVLFPGSFSLTCTVRGANSWKSRQGIELIVSARVHKKVPESRTGTAEHDIACRASHRKINCPSGQRDVQTGGQS
ncbi:hypothetical protein EDB81DRAFT_66676 [Dactylonectria macrodidyma]|uniref:Uncharacterized protein n=1 Tax=Dactylonectria macrodidyma TaxID=307937 RepID=A0A9P9EPC0_9HYPO|nr:hypothetical protein EDB81DRAFT_66676 [Dactylonectria macrodidyma]